MMHLIFNFIAINYCFLNLHLLIIKLHLIFSFLLTFLILYPIQYSFSKIIIVMNKKVMNQNQKLNQIQ